MVPGDIHAKKTRETFHKLHIKFFFQRLIVNSLLLWAFVVQNFCENSFWRVKRRKSGITAIKTTFFAKNPLELQVSISYHQNY